MDRLIPTFFNFHCILLRSHFLHLHFLALSHTIIYLLLLLPFLLLLLHLLLLLVFLLLLVVFLLLLLLFLLLLSLLQQMLSAQAITVQVALLYTNSSGERRIRVHTVLLPVVQVLRQCCMWCCGVMQCSAVF